MKLVDDDEVGPFSPARLRRSGESGDRCMLRRTVVMAFETDDLLLTWIDSDPLDPDYVSDRQHSSSWAGRADLGP